jgi:hypothetical protein
VVNSSAGVQDEADLRILAGGPETSHGVVCTDICASVCTAVMASGIGEGMMEAHPTKATTASASTTVAGTDIRSKWTVLRTLAQNIESVRTLS